jgi:hypothetical protein
MVIGTGAAIVGGKMQGDASNEAAGIASASTKHGADMAAEVQTELYDKGQAATAPWRQQGSEALGMLEGIYGTDPSMRDSAMSGYDVQPSTNFDIEESERQIARTMNAQGLGGSGAEARAMMENRGNIATSNFNTYTSGLQSLAGLGQTPSTQTSSLSQGLGQNLASTYGNAATQQGNIQAQNIMNQSNIKSNVLEQGASAYGEYRGSNY